MLRSCAFCLRKRNFLSIIECPRFEGFNKCLLEDTNFFK